MLTGLRYAALATPDLPALAAFYGEGFGLVPVEGGAHSDVVHLATAGSDEPFALRLRGAHEARVDLVALAAVDAAAVDALHERTARAGARLLGEPGPLATPGGGYGFRFFDRDGHVLEVSVAGERRPPLPAPFAGAPVAVSHVVWNSTDPDALAAFYCDALGFQVSDRLDDKMTFLRCGPDHHRVAVARSTTVGLNHIAYTCPELDGYLRATGRLVRRGVPLLWGPGRHGPGDNTYAYFTDPAGFICEYTTDLEQVGPDHEPRVWASSPEATDQWGLSNERPHRALAGWADPGCGIAPPI